MQGCLCRSCDVPFQDLGNPLSNNSYRKVFCPQVRKLRNNLSEANKMKLVSLGYREFHDGFVEVHFSDPRRGLNWATPPEILHMYHMGVEERVIECCLGARKTRKLKGK